MDGEIKYTQKYNSETFFEEIEAVIPQSIVDKNFNKAVELVQKTAVMPGFRKGKVPKDIVMSKFIQDISDRAINLCIEESVKNLKDLKPTPLEPLNITNFKKDEDSGNLVVTFTYVPRPDVELGTLDNIKVGEVKPKEVSDEEVEKELENLCFEYSRNQNPELKREEFKLKDLKDDFIETSGITKQYPEVKTMDDLRNFVRDFIANTYKSSAQTDWEQNVRKKIVEKCKFVKEEGLVQKELDKRIESYKERFSQIGLNPDEYLKEKNIDLEKLREEWKPQVEEDIKLELVLQKYGAEKKFAPSDEELKQNLQSLDKEVKKRYNNDVETLESLIRYYYINQKSYEDIMNLVKSNSGLEDKEVVKEENK
jgi:FKBP-type peptidyl-prolyl cis-trans isomerase (trigger factor)